MKSKLITKVALIGGGPACATAAIQLARSGIEIILVSKEIGGTIKNANLVENLIGYPDGVVGKDFAKSFQLQLTKAGVPIVLEEVLTVEQMGNKYTTKTAETEIISEYLIIGTGSIPKKLDVEGEKEAFLNRKLFYEMYNFKQFADKKDIGIIGSGDVAYDYALNLQNVANKISIIRRTDKTSSLPILQKRVKNTDNIVFLNNHVIKKVEIKDDKTSLEIDEDGKLITMIKDLVLVAIGRKPNYNFLSEDLISEYNNPKSDSKLYFIGDVNKNNFRQVSIAMGDGMKVAMETVKRIIEKEDYHGTSSQVW
ncbi:MAG: NAD(P)/FAD-dependent oxidoreductase [Candidatus Heimdallarchaeota archaeon]|nr:NAD(P)/FAD-dependent oxidoreductase [Candidatus Heimdallarchaeota archaeon]